MLKKALVTQSEVFPRQFPGQDKVIHLIQRNHYSDRDINPEAPEYKVAMIIVYSVLKVDGGKKRIIFNFPARGIYAEVTIRFRGV
jgi:hypothetical protein